MTAAEPLVAMAGVSKRFPLKQGLFRRSSRAVHAVDNTSLELPYGITMGLVGESGSGKSTLARLLLRLEDVTEGTIVFRGGRLDSLHGSRLRSVRSSIQMVFQDPYSSFDPTSPMSRSVIEPRVAVESLSRRERQVAARELFELVGLRAALLDRYPNELSGGQLQRAAIARALSTRPPLVVLDEPVSALDVSTQAQIINLLQDLQAELQMTYLFVAHDLAVVRHISQRVAVMYLGQIVEEGPTASVFEQPAHPYTAALLSSIATVSSDRSGRPRIPIRGEIPSPVDPPSGCRFHTRCPWAMKICSEVAPSATATRSGATSFCHLHDQGPTLQGETVLNIPLPVASGG